MVTNLPNDPQAERKFLGLLFTRPQFVLKFSGLVFPRDFYKYDLQLIYASMQRIAANDDLPLDMVGVTRELLTRKELDKAGGSINISEIASLSINEPLSISDFQRAKNTPKLSLIVRAAAPLSRHLKKQREKLCAAKMSRGLSSV